VPQQAEVIPIGTAATKFHPPERSHVELSEPDDVERYLEEVYGARLRLSGDFKRPHDGASSLTHVRIDVGPFAIDEIRAPGKLQAAPDPLNKVAVVWATGGRVSGWCDGIDGQASSGEIALLSQPDLPHHNSSEDLTARTVLLDHSLVAGVATGTPSGQAPLPVRFSAFGPVDEKSSRLWKDTVQYVRNCLLSDETFATPLVIGHASRLLAAVTLGAFPNTTSVHLTAADRTDHHPVLLRRAMEFMDANAANDISLADIAEAVHVTPRAVQYMFRRHLDTTPVAYLRRLRLHYAHQDLVAGNRLDHTVTGIAARWGFAHTGRFAVMYRETYGQSPHTTLRD
jgi:AraC-like DNA-binding protein